MVQFRCLPAAAFLPLLATVLPIVGCFQPQERIYLPEHVTARIFQVGQAMPELRTDRYRGRIEAGREAQLGFEMAGTLSDDRAVVGTFVRKGEVLARLDVEQLKHVREGLHAAEILSKTSYQRLDTVFNRGSVAEIKVLEAGAQYEQARAALGAADLQIRKMTIVAPFDGYVTKMLAQRGSLTAPLTPIITVADISVLKAVVQLSEYEVGAFNRGDSAEIRAFAADGLTAFGKVVEVALDSDVDPASYSVKIRFPNPHQSFLPGMACKVRPISKRRKGPSMNGSRILIPSDAVRSDGGTPYVYIYEPQTSQARRRYVTVGEIVGYGTEITSGLVEGESVIVGSGSGVGEGTLIETMK